MQIVVHKPGQLAVYTDAELALAALEGSGPTWADVYGVCPICGHVVAQMWCKARSDNHTDNQALASFFISWCRHKQANHATWNVGITVELFARSLCG